MPYRTPVEEEELKRLRKLAIVTVFLALHHLPKTGFTADDVMAAIKDQCGGDEKLFLECCIMFAALPRKHAGGEARP